LREDVHREVALEARKSRGQPPALAGVEKGKSGEVTP
jgi:hypothetical protein